MLILIIMRYIAVLLKIGVLVKNQDYLPENLELSAQKADFDDGFLI